MSPFCRFSLVPAALEEWVPHAGQGRYADMFHQQISTDIVNESASSPSSGQLGHPALAPAQASSYGEFGHPVVVPAQETCTLSDFAQFVAHLAYVASCASVYAWTVVGTDSKLFVLEILAYSIMCQCVFRLIEVHEQIIAILMVEDS